MEVWKIMFLSKWVICRFHVDLPGCRIEFRIYVYFIYTFIDIYLYILIYIFAYNHVCINIFIYTHTPEFSHGTQGQKLVFLTWRPETRELCGLTLLVNGWKMTFLLGLSIFRGCFSFRECIWHLVCKRTVTFRS